MLPFALLFSLSRFTMSDYQFVDDFYDVIESLKATETAGVDTEFLREKTYFSQLCLIQFSSGEAIYCIDPMRPHDYTDFWDALCSSRWIVHSGRQDTEVIFQTAGKLPERLFDTQIAAGLLGMAPQMGYANLVQTLFDVQLPKSHTRADWSRRPLPSEWLRYAADDVTYLLPALALLSEKLDKVGRLAWAEEDSSLLLDPTLYDPQPEEAVHRVKGARNFHGRRRAAAAALAEWREKEAVRRNRPRQWILRDSTLLDMAVRQPARAGDLRRIDGFPAKLIDRAGERLVSIIANAGDDAHYRPPRPPDEAQKRLIGELQARVTARAKELDITAEVLAPRKELSAAVVVGSRDTRVFGGWRRDVIGAELAAML
ncbi:MAG: HRDC domain-containing protein [Pseudomonadota bacterium]